MKKLNVLIATEAFYPDAIGGAHTYVYNLARNLVRRNHEVHVLTLKIKKDAPYQEEIEGIKVLRYNSAPDGPLAFIRRPILSIVNSYRLFNKITRKTKFDILHFHSSLPAFGINFSTNSKKIPKIYTFHSSMYLEVLEQSKKKRYAGFVNSLIFSVIKWIEKVNFKNSDRVITLSEFSKRRIFEIYGLRYLAIVVVSGGVDTERFKPPEEIMSLRKKLNLRQNKIIILTVRRLAARMGLENLISAIKIVVSKNKSISLLIIGEGFLKEKLKRLIEKEKLEAYIKLLGAKSIEEISHYYQASDFFVLPTEYSEWFGLVTLEALACGVPVLATPIGGTVEILQDLDKKLLFEGVSPEHIAKGILDFLNSEKEWEEMRNRCRQYVVNNYPWDVVVSKTENLYFELLKHE